jgi:hypothetical protein
VSGTTRVVRGHGRTIHDRLAVAGPGGVRVHTVAKIIAIAVTVGVVTGLEMIGVNRIVAALAGITAGVAVLALLRLSNLGNRQHDPAVDRAATSKSVSKKTSAKRSKGR